MLPTLLCRFLRVFLEGLASAALTADVDFASGHCAAPSKRGLTAFANVYVGWDYSQVFHRDGLCWHLGFVSIDQLIEFRVVDHLQQDARTLGLDCQILDSDVDSDFGHIAGGPRRLTAEPQTIFKALKSLLAKTQ